MKSPLLAAIVSVGLLSAPAFAGTSSDATFEMDVKFDRDALSDAQALPTEYERIEKQVSKRCETENSGFNPVRKYVAVRACVNATLDNTVAEISHADLSAYHREQRFG